MAEPAPQELGEPPSVAALSLAETANPGPKHATEQEINPWGVQAATDEQGNVLAFDYEGISKKWNTNLIDQVLLDRFERVTGHKPHRWLRRGLFFSHRDFDKILDVYERGEDFLLYTGRGPSSGSMHIGHTIVSLLPDDTTIYQTDGPSHSSLPNGSKTSSMYRWSSC
jgi:tryptophanyl-tRNA synthetase